MDPIVIMFVIAALAIGALIGWLIWGRPAAQSLLDRDEARSERDAVRIESENWRNKFNEAIVNLASESEKAKRLVEVETQLTGERKASVTLQTEVAAFRRGEIERERAHEEQLAQLKGIETKLEARFGDLAGKALETAHDAFLKRAQLSLGRTGEQNEAKLKELLQPVQTTLSRYEAGLRALEQDRKGAYEGLNARIAMLSEGQEKVANEALRLRTALRSSTGDVGRWGEDQCRNILENAGMQEGIDFDQQVSTDTVEDQSKPDFVVRLPGNRKLIIDVKCSVDAYLGAEETDDASIKENLLVAHAKAIRNHANSLGKRAYQDKINRSLSYIVMFIPGENFLYAAIKRDKKLLRDAQNNKISIVGPSNLLGIILNAAALRDQARLAERAEEIGALGRKLYENISTLGKKSHAMSSAMRSVVNNWNSLVSTLDGHWLGTARKFDELGVGKSSGDIRELQSIVLPVNETKKLSAIGITDEPDDVASSPTIQLAPPPSSNKDDAEA